MTQHDMDNLNFLLSIDDKALADWFAKTTKHDHDYAVELLNAFSQEIKLAAEELRIESELANNNFKESQNFLKKFMANS